MFQGFVISDWAGIDQLTYPWHTNYTYSSLEGVIDMVMNNNFVQMTRIDDAIKRILRVKFQMGLFENPLTDYSLIKYLGILRTRTIDPETKVVYKKNPDSEFIKSNNFSYSIVMVKQTAYAECYGDSLNLTIPAPGPDIMTSVCASVKCVVVPVTGRPIVIQPYLDQMDALVAAWLPGTEGQGVADVLFGDYGFTGNLTRTWFKTVDQLSINVGDSHLKPVKA
ncbi:hypothetical protein MTR67_035159 [Solanum verrucosum]|uniref:Glycoside hydrolase family 3 C-terminal domain-containing protein n=1 Tax=Solanum verrucosum TaxID=315347 RepID=A0AAF0U9X8_SOLVR|nr:hypothetical protein MTR67_035159 [Solanum verrucosum]